MRRVSTRRLGGSDAGLTILEVLVALIVLAVGVGALVTFQAWSLSTLRRARVWQELITATETELHRLAALAGQSAGECPDFPAFLSDQGATCRVNTVGCTVIPAGVNCGGAGQRARSAHVEVSDSEEWTFGYTLIAARFEAP